MDEGGQPGAKVRVLVLEEGRTLAGGRTTVLGKGNLLVEK